MPTILICLLLGLALNFGVAYACARWSPISPPIILPVGSFSGAVIVPKSVGHGLGVRESKSEADGYETWNARMGMPFSTFGLSVVEDRKGGAVFDFSMTMPWDSPNPAILQQTFYQTGDRTWSLLPLGTIINTLFYAALLFALWITPGALVYWNRARRGRCTRCAYDITGVVICPECGTPAPTPVQPAS